MEAAGAAAAAREREGAWASSREAAGGPGPGSAAMVEKRDECHTTLLLAITSILPLIIILLR